METPISKVRGLGSAKSGAHHWWLERLLSIATFSLFIWFIASLLILPSLDYQAVVEWLHSPLVAVPMLLLIVSVFWHMKLGLQVVVDDYVHDEGNRFFSVMLINFSIIAGAAFAIFAVLKIALGGDASNG